ncbi:hypothetical protein [Stenotrophomonas lactitubi]|uniref:hypothetical protein n=1 Tax=Stenotrophomonas lactitubi TaxID=2045214 RepID=UPI001D23E55C|nr:hypothetical protein [Stenotrophomonas lactitubi]CAH0138726.1 hypothetical protein SRABI122_00411 [Stenotrophomonas lactitubi]CAH0154017.1 hypothetical protein SRABI66_00787 [Stenotrophomonas lactitubi]CAH0171000.1 hypothetical protein SRABI81_01211 [Stenotrophomonas lactitubi]CAH0205509.1 hypothetical protein SRABI102_01882 [Stenotrophomonas lactitubi]
MMDIAGIDIAAGGAAALLGKYLWDRFASTEGKSYDALVQQQGDRINAQEQRLVVLEQGLDEERKARRDAESKVYELAMRIMRLEFELKKHNIEVPQ